MERSQRGSQCCHSFSIIDNKWICLLITTSTLPCYGHILLTMLLVNNVKTFMKISASNTYDLLSIPFLCHSQNIYLSLKVTVTLCVCVCVCVCVCTMRENGINFLIKLKKDLSRCQAFTKCIGDLLGCSQV